MKRIFLVATTCLCLFHLSAAQDTSSTAAVTAAREESEERFRQMAADLESLHAANVALTERLTALEEQVRQLREAQAKAPAPATQEDLKLLAQKLEEVDRKRAEDKQAISEEIKQSAANLEKALASNPPPAARVATAKHAPEPTDKNYLYVVREGDYLSGIVQAYNADFKSKGLKTITLKQVKELNPELDWNRLRVGQKILIPKPQ